MMEITIKIYNNYIWEKSRNGGNYGFEEIFTGVDNNSKFELYFYTTAQFSYCEYCGKFTDNCYCDSPTVYTFSEMLNYIRDKISNFREGDSISADEEFTQKRGRQVRDALNKCKDIERIETVACVFGV